MGRLQVLRGQMRQNVCCDELGMGRYVVDVVVVVTMNINTVVYYQTRTGTAKVEERTSRE